MDFTLKIYGELLATLKKGGFSFQTFREFIENPADKVIVLRHDVDMLPQNALITALIEHNINIRGSYYFRIIPKSYDRKVIEKIHELGHEVGYHYENMDFVADNIKAYKRSLLPSDVSAREEHIMAAWEDFKANLARLREIVPIYTIAMHGSPRSYFNNLDLWKRFDYREVGIIGEPYLDVDYSQVFYLTDTGRRWNGERVSIRDRVDSANAFDELKFRHTSQIIAAAREGGLPEKMMINVHPQRWTDNPLPWLRELVWQNIKNVVKRCLVKT
jgi:hypothetical protein